MTTYTTQQMTTYSGATARQLRHWADRGWLTTQTPGSGHGWVWTMRDRRIATIMMRLVSAGFAPEKAHPIAVLILDNKTDKDGVRIKLGENVWIIVRGIER